MKNSMKAILIMSMVFIASVSVIGTLSSTETVSKFTETVTAYTEVIPTSGEPLPGHRGVSIKVSNGEQTRYSDGGVFDFFLGTSSGGQNALQYKTNNATQGPGEIINTESEEGTFYIGNTGGQWVRDTVLLMLAINGTIPEDFKLTITSFGYVWDPLSDLRAAPAYENLQYKIGINKTLNISDFIYSSIWKPSYDADNPIFGGQNMSDLDNTFSIAFIDLDVGIIGDRALSSYDTDLINNGMIRVDYVIENLLEGSSLIINQYGFLFHANEGGSTAPGVYWTNNVTDTLFTYTATGIKKPIDDDKKPPADNNNNTPKPPANNTNNGTKAPNNVPNTSNNGVWTINSKMTNSEIKTVINRAKNGEKIVFTSGNYKNLQLNINKPLQISTRGNVKVTGTGKETLFKVKSNKVSIKGFKVNNYRNGVVNQGTKNVITNNKITKSKNIGINNKGSKATISRNTVTRNKHGIYNTGKQTTISKNTAKNNKQIGIYSSGKSSTISKNTVTRNKKIGIQTKNKHTVKGNIAKNNKRNIVKR